MKKYLFFLLMLVGFQLQANSKKDERKTISGNLIDFTLIELSEACMDELLVPALVATGTGVCWATYRAVLFAAARPVPVLGATVTAGSVAYWYWKKQQRS